MNDLLIITILGLSVGYMSAQILNLGGLKELLSNK